MSEMAKLKHGKEVDLMNIRELLGQLISSSGGTYMVLWSSC